MDTANLFDNIFSSGTGEIIEITFLAFNAQDSTSTMISLDEEDTNISGYNLNDNSKYLFDLDYWTIIESLVINF